MTNTNKGGFENCCFKNVVLKTDEGISREGKFVIIKIWREKGDKGKWLEWSTTGKIEEVKKIEYPISGYGMIKFFNKEDRIIAEDLLSYCLIFWYNNKNEAFNDYINRS